MNNALKISCTILVLAVLFCPAARLVAETLTYREVEGAAVATHVLSLRPDGTGFSVELATTRPNGTVRQTFRTAADLTTLEWTFSDPARRMELAAAVQGSDIVLVGSFQGKKVARKFPAAGAPWNQLFQVGLGPFALSARESFQFRSIGTQGPGELKIGKFSVTRKAAETIAISGMKHGTVRLRISLSGLLSVFWHGDYWYRATDGRFLRYRGKNRSGGPVAVSELVGETAE